MAKSLETVFLFVAAFSGFLWLRGGVVNDAQLYFRVGLTVVGILGFAVVKLLNKKPPQ